MRRFNKRGQDVSFNWLIGTLAGVLLGGVILAAGLQWYQTTTKTKDSFTMLTSDIESMKDGESVFLPYYLPDGYLLVSFAGGKDFNTNQGVIASLRTGQSCDGKVNIPKACGDYPCLCVCSGTYSYGYETSCTDRAIACYPFTSEATKGLSLSDHECSTGVYRPGPSNGVFSLYLQRTGNNIEFCSVQGCVTEQEKTVVDATSKLLKDYQSCMQNRQDCACSLDMSPIPKGYALVWSAEKVELIDLATKAILSTTTFTTNIGAKDVQATSMITIYPFKEETYATQDNTPEYVDTHYILSSTLEIPSLSGVIIPDGEIQQVLYKKEGKMLFVNKTEDLSALPSCTTQTSSNAFV